MTSKTTIDWLNFRSQGEVLQTLEALRPLFGTLGCDLNLQHLPRGKDGFQQASALRVQDLVIGRLDFGGDSQRGWVRTNITGQGCEWVKEWTAIDSVEALPRAEIKRVDVALTTWKGEVTHELVEAAHGSGGFTSRGRPPSMQRILNSDPRAGQTCNIGVRKASDQFFRGYEKGLELASKLGALGRTVTHIDGCAIEDIYRCEVEYKASSRPIPWEVIERRDEYFAGSYPFLAGLLPDVECDILMRRPERAPQLDLRALLANVRHQYGSGLYTALVAHHGDIGAVWEQIVGSQHHEGLLSGGVLLVEH
jgi:phage replication initiation protein